jgi:hypothetical protein
MEVCVASRDWCVKHLYWILMRESVSVVTLFQSARNCFLKLRVGLNPYLRVCFGCLLLEMFQVKLRYAIVCDAIDCSCFANDWHISLKWTVTDFKEWCPSESE